MLLKTVNTFAVNTKFTELLEKQTQSGIGLKSFSNSKRTGKIKVMELKAQYQRPGLVINPQGSNWAKIQKNVRFGLIKWTW